MYIIDERDKFYIRYISDKLDNVFERDYSLYAYMLKDLKIIRDSYLDNLCYHICNCHCVRNDILFIFELMTKYYLENED